MARRSFISGSSEWPPARSLASSPCSAEQRPAPRRRSQRGGSRRRRDQRCSSRSPRRFGDGTHGRRSGRGGAPPGRCCGSRCTGTGCPRARADLVLGRVRVSSQQRDRGHHHARCAEAALQAVLLAERLLDRVQLRSAPASPSRVVTEPPSAWAASTVHDFTDSPSVQDRARAARRGVTADVGAVRPARRAGGARAAYGPRSRRRARPLTVIVTFTRPRLRVPCVDGGPDPHRARGHVDVPHAEVGDRVDHRVLDGRRRADRARPRRCPCAERVEGVGVVGGDQLERRGIRSRDERGSRRDVVVVGLPSSS